MDIHFTTQISKEGRMFVAYSRELDLSSCGGTREKAVRNLKEAVRLFLEEAEQMGTLDKILEEAGYLSGRAGSRWKRKSGAADPPRCRRISNSRSRERRGE